MQSGRVATFESECTHIGEITRMACKLNGKCPGSRQLGLNWS